jgi:hypothetical protein
MQSWYTTAAGYPGTRGDAADPSPAVYPPGSTPITEAQYNLDLAAHVAARQATIDADAAAECNARKDAFDELVLLGITGASAQVISGWNGGPC